ncbi:MAG: hypothetical protein ACK50S_00215 [bacterium]|jgi:hypothetical protein
MGVSLDLRKAHASRQHGDLLVIYTWINDERAMVLLPHRRPGAPWYVVMESASFTWDDADPKNVANVVRKVTTACTVLGIEPTPINCRRVAGIIIDGLPELIRMPSSPPVEYHAGSFGRLELRADGKPLAGENLRVEKEGVTYAQ